MSIRELTLERVYDAPRQLVFRAWTDPHMLAEWWGPRGFSNPTCEWNARPGGKIRVFMKASDEIAKVIGPGAWMGGEFREVVANERLVFVSTALAGENGEVQLENLNTVTFADEGSKTRLTLHVQVKFASPAMEGALAGMETGWSQSLDKLQELLDSPLG